MSELSDELEANAMVFRDNWSMEISSNINALSRDPRFVDSYRRAASLQAMRIYLIAPSFSADALAFFAEAQNDALTSHVLASFGAWRSALQSLRSCIENIYGALYFNDHEVEFQLWTTGLFRLSSSSAHKYFCDHPGLDGVSQALSGLDALKEEYATLSKAVHASAKSFRMSDEGARLLLWSNDVAKLGAWSTRHRKVVEAISLLTVCLHAKKLSGAGHHQLRAVLGYAISESRRAQLRAQLHVHIEDPT